MILFFDTETTGLSPSSTLLQMAGKLVDTKCHRVAGFNNIIYQDQLQDIPTEASNIHKIFYEDMVRNGIDKNVAFSLFIENVKKADKIVAHNIQYDLGIMKTFAMQLNRENEIKNAFTNKQIICTMKLLKDIVKLPPSKKQAMRGITDYKYPKLSEAYEYFFNKPISGGAHDAMNDVNACVKLYFKVKELMK